MISVLGGRVCFQRFPIFLSSNAYGRGGRKSGRRLTGLPLGGPWPPSPHGVGAVKDALHGRGPCRRQRRRRAQQPAGDGGDAGGLVVVVEDVVGERRAVQLDGAVVQVLVVAERRRCSGRDGRRVIVVQRAAAGAARDAVAQRGAEVRPQQEVDDEVGRRADDDEQVADVVAVRDRVRTAERRAPLQYRHRHLRVPPANQQAATAPVARGSIVATDAQIVPATQRWCRLID